MIVKRFLCILISACILVFSAAMAENDGISLTFMADGDEIFIASSLLPDSKISVCRPDGADPEQVLSMIRPNLLPDMIGCFRESIMDRNRINASIQKGSYAGDLFDYACEKAVLILTAEDMENLVAELSACFRDSHGTEAGSISAEDAAKSAESILRSAAGMIFDREMTACISTYDEKYVTMDIVRQDETVFTLSVDLSGRDSFRLVMARQAEDAAYYDEVTCSVSSGEIAYSFSLYRTAASSFRMVKEEECVQFAEISFLDLDSENWSFEGEIHSVLLPAAAHIKGNRTTGKDDKGIIVAGLSFDGQMQEISEILLSALNSILQP